MSFKLPEDQPLYPFEIGLSFVGNRSVILTNDGKYVWRCRTRISHPNGDMAYFVCVCCEGLKDKMPIPHLKMFIEFDNERRNLLVTDPNDPAVLHLHRCAGDANANRAEQLQRFRTYQKKLQNGDSDLLDFSRRSGSMMPSFVKDDDMNEEDGDEAPEETHSNMMLSFATDQTAILSERMNEDDGYQAEAREETTPAPVVEARGQDKKIEDFARFVASSIQCLGDSRKQDDVMFRIHSFLHEAASEGDKVM
uniref:MSP domain-containing protein n=1 Tax=Steinernema glaseri TaxID=37863 RepID=A0A1I7Y6M9_9BILA